MNGAKIYQQQIWGTRNYQITSYFVAWSSWPIRFNTSDIHRPVSTQYFEFITKLKSSNYEFAKNPVESCLSVCSIM